MTVPTKVIVPDFNFSAFYYADILRNLRNFNRVNAPEITSEVAEEAFIQLERAFALVGHLSNSLTDLAAVENLLPTAKLPDSVRNMLKLIDYQMADYSPASVDLLMELTQVLAVSTSVLPENSLFETERTEESQAIPFEVLAEKYVGPTNVIDAAFGAERIRYASDGATIFGDPTSFSSVLLAIEPANVGCVIRIKNSIYGNNGEFVVASIQQAGAVSRVKLGKFAGGREPLFIAESNLSWELIQFTANGASAINTAGAPYFTPLTTPVAGDAIYFGSRYVMTDRIDFTLNQMATNILGAWEYFDPNLADELPDTVTNLGTQLRFTLTSLLGAADRRGAMVKVTYLPTGVNEILPSAWEGGLNVATATAFLGQSGVPSTDVGNYSVGVEWNEVPSAVDGTGNLSANGNVTFSVPQDENRKWEKVSINGVEGYYLRYRVIAVSTPTTPILNLVTITQGKQYILEVATQGETVTGEPLQSSSGQPSQEFELASYPGLRDSVECFVTESGAEVEWSNVTALGLGLITSGPRDRHFSVSQDAEGIITIKFGDGTHGRIPPLGVSNLRFSYRINATQDGNVGSSTVTVNSGGASLIRSVTNPRSAAGWQEADGASDLSLARVKELGPASLRALHRAVAPEDYETLAMAWKNANGVRPVVRAKAIEEGFGPKTIKLVVVGTNGVGISNEDKTALETYFNGDPVLNVGGVGGGNREVTVVNFIPRQVAPSVSIEANSALTQAMVLTKLVALLSPTAVDSAGAKFLWPFGGRVPTSRMASEIFQLSPGNIFDVDVLLPASDVELAEDELPMPNSVGMTVVITPPRRT